MRIAILEDDQALRELTASWLEEAGHDVYPYPLGRDFMRGLVRESYDLCLLDWMLPDLEGIEVLRWLREDRGSDLPVLFITARNAEEDIVAALQGGADDYLVKPLRRMELLSRIDAVSRRARPAARDSALSFGNYTFDVAAKSVRFGEETATLTDKEFELALFFFRNLGRLFSRGHLLESIWGRKPNIPTRTIDTHISRIRSKLQLRAENGFRMLPTYNYGYRLEAVEPLADDTVATQESADHGPR